jgi:tetratricopeptide (TPR) repeat protein
MKNSRYYIFLTSLLFLTFGFSQTNYPEIDTLLSKSKTLRKTNIDSSLFYAEKAYNKAIKTNNANAIGWAIIEKSSCLLNKNLYKEAEELLQQNLSNHKNITQTILGGTYFNLACIAHQEEKRDQTINYYIKAIDLFPKDQYRNISRSYLGIGSAYDILGKKEQANYFYNKSLDFIKKNKGKLPHTESMAIISDTDRIKNCLHFLKGIKDKDNSYVAAAIYEDLAEAYYAKKDYPNALISAQQSLKITTKNNYTFHKDNCQFIIANSYYALNNDKSIIYYKKTLKETSKIRLKSKILKKLAFFYKKKKDYKNALINYELYNSIADSINLLKENERIAEIIAQFETEKQAQEIVVLETDNKLKTSKLDNQKNILWASAIGGLLLLLSLFFIYRNYKIKQNLQFSQLTQKLLLMQLNPHFLFNALNGIQYFIKKNDVKKSTKYISSFSGLMRNILENSVEKFISIKEDSDTIKDFLELQQLVHNNSFDYNITIDENLDVQNMCIPPMFTQPFVENAIIHGVSSIKNGEIIVNYKLQNNTILVEIEDNGKGVETSKQSANSLHKSMGTSITKQRIENLLKTEKYPIELEIVSKSKENGEQGTKVILSFPIKYL